MLEEYDSAIFSAETKIRLKSHESFRAFERNKGSRPQFPQKIDNYSSDLLDKLCLLKMLFSVSNAPSRGDIQKANFVQVSRYTEKDVFALRSLI